MAHIRDLPSGWRQKLLPAAFRSANFHVESGAKENGRRIVTHEFPKKDYPYSEDMGRRAYQFTVRGYCVQYGFDADVSSLLYRRDYTRARDALEAELSNGEPGTLQLPMMNPLTVVCPRWRVTEEEKTGGYCVFDMTFVELGIKPGQLLQEPRSAVISEWDKLRAQINQRIKDSKNKQLYKKWFPGVPPVGPLP